MANCSNCGRTVSCGCQLSNGLCTKCRESANKLMTDNLAKQQSQPIDLVSQIKGKTNVKLSNS